MKDNDHKEQRLLKRNIVGCSSEYRKSIERKRSIELEFNRHKDFLSSSREKLTYKSRFASINLRTIPKTSNGAIKKMVKSATRYHHRVEP